MEDLAICPTFLLAVDAQPTFFSNISAQQFPSPHTTSIWPHIKALTSALKQTTVSSRRNLVSKMLSTHSIIAFTLQFLLTFVTPACVPDVPEKILWDPAVLKHPAVTSALQIVEQKLNELMNTTGDALSLAIVGSDFSTQVTYKINPANTHEQAHASGQESVFAFNHGTLRMNETSDSTDNIVTSDSIFRVMSVSKNFAAFSALVVENLCESKTDALATFSLDTPVRAILPQFKLPEKDWHDGGKDITLRMLASHSSGIMREAYSTELNMVLGTSKVDVDMFEANFRSATPDGVLEYVKKNNLMFAPGQRAACRYPDELNFITD